MVKTMNKQISNFKFKLYFFGVTFLLALIGCLIGAIFTELENNFPTYFTNSIGMTFLLGIITIFLTIIVHELAHLLHFVCHGYKIRLFVLGPFSFHKKSNKWKVTFKFNLSLGFGGLVIPNIEKINKKQHFEKITTEYSRNMLTTPLVSLLQGVVSLLLIIFLLPKCNIYIQSSIFTILITSLLTTIYINVTSLINIGGIVGDYRASSLFKHNNVFSAYQLYTYSMLSTEKENIIKDNTVLKNIFLSKLNTSYEKKEFDNFSCLLTDIFIYEYITYNIPIPEKAMKCINYYIDNIGEFYSKLIFECYYILYSHIIVYLAEKNLKKSIELWETIRIKFPPNKIAKYYELQIDSKLYNNVSKELLTNKNNIYISSIDSILGVLDNYYDSEILLNSK